MSWLNITKHAVSFAKIRILDWYFRLFRKSFEMDLLVSTWKWFWNCLRSQHWNIRSLILSVFNKEIEIISCVFNIRFWEFRKGHFNFNLKVSWRRSKYFILWLLPYFWLSHLSIELYFRVKIAVRLLFYELRVWVIHLNDYWSFIWVS